MHLRFTVYMELKRFHEFLTLKNILNNRLFFEELKVKKKISVLALIKSHEHSEYSYIGLGDFF